MLDSVEKADLAPEMRAGCGPVSPLWCGSSKPLHQQIFECVRGAGQIARVDVARQLNVSAGSVTALTSRLIEEKYIEEVAQNTRDNENARGRPRVALQVCGDSHYVVGIKLSSPNHSAVIIDLAGNEIASVVSPRAHIRQAADILVEETIDLLDRLLAKAKLKKSDINAVGLGLPGVVDAETGKVAWSPIMADRDVELCQLLHAATALPFKIDNDANLLTLAEMWFGAGRNLDSFAVVTIEHGLGMGMVIDHQIYRGARGMGMELGHTKVQLDGALCRCGQRGCLEAYVADYALVREASTALNWTSLDANLDDLLDALFDHAKAGNREARSIFKRAGRYLALGLSNVINLYDPKLIILSGERMQYDYLYAEEVLNEVKALTLNARNESPPIEIHAWGDLAWARGAAALALTDLTTEIFANDAA